MNVKPEYLLDNANLKRPKSRVEALRAQTADSDNYSSDEFETSGVYSTDGFEDEDDEGVNTSMSSTRTGALTIEGRQRTFSTSIGVSDHGFKDYSQKMHEEHAAVACNLYFKGFKSRKNIHKSGSPRKTPQKRPSKSDSTPQYLIGGNNVVGIADWLGQTLSRRLYLGLDYL